MAHRRLEPRVSNLPVLLRKYKETHRRYVELEHELADLNRQILATDRPATKRRRPAQPLAAIDEVRALLRVLREAEAPLPPREIASRLGVETVVVSRRLARARRLGYVEPAGRARYRVADAVPSL
jgi:chromatin segregation and condensation protein Rec8/ScpA/Scc1 (kleisin family)